MQSDSSTNKITLSDVSEYRTINLRRKRQNLFSESSPYTDAVTVMMKKEKERKKERSILNGSKSLCR